MLDATTRALRAGRIGSSDASVVVGVDPWRGPADLWAQLTGRTPGRSIDDDPAVRAGTWLEHGLVAWSEHLLDAPVTRDVFVEHPNGVAVANLDGLAWTEPPIVVEAKAIGIVAAPGYLDEFGAERSDVVPAHTLVQVQHQLACLRDSPDPEHRRVRRALVVTCLRNRGLVPFFVERDDAFCDALLDDEQQFMTEFVAADRMPPGEPPRMETLSTWRRLAELPAQQVDPALVRAWLDARDTLDLVKREESDAKRALLAALGDAEVGDAGDLGRVTFFESKRGGYVVEPTTYRTLRHYLPRPARPNRKRK